MKMNEIIGNVAVDQGTEDYKRSCDRIPDIVRVFLGIDKKNPHIFMQAPHRQDFIPDLYLEYGQKVDVHELAVTAERFGKLLDRCANSTRPAEGGQLFGDKGDPLHGRARERSSR